MVLWAVSQSDVVNDFGEESAAGKKRESRGRMGMLEMMGRK